MPYSSPTSGGPPAPSGPAHHAARLGASMLAILQHLHAIHEYVLHASRILMRLLECGVVLNARGVEHHDVRIIAGLEQPTPAQLEILGRQCGETTNGRPRISSRRAHV